MADKVIVLPNKEDKRDVLALLDREEVKVISSMGSFILIKEPSPSQITQLEGQGTEVQDISVGIGDLTQFDEEDQLLMGAYLMRKAPDYIQELENADLDESIEEREMLEHSCKDH